MKYLKMFLVSLLLLVAVNTHAASFTYSSGILSSSTLVSKVPCLLTDVAVYTDGTNAVTVILYDSNTTATGTVIGKLIVPGASYNGGITIPTPVKAKKGVYMSLSGTGGTAIIFTTPQ